MGLQELQIVQVHSEAQLVQQGGKAGFIQGGEAGNSLHGGGDVILHFQGFHRLQVRLPGLHGVDDVVLDLVHVGGSQIAGEQIDPGSADSGAVTLGHQLDALAGGVRPLVELAGQVLHGEGNAILGGQGGGGVIHLGLGKHCLHGPLEGLFVQALHVIAVQQPQPRQSGDAQQGPQLVQKTGGLLAQSRLLFYIDTSYHGYPSIAASARRPMSWRMYLPSNSTVSAAA